MTGRVHDRVLGFMTSSGSSESFEELALAVFSHQYEMNPAYRRWCETCGRGPGDVRSGDEIPAVPTAAFKELEFVCGEAVAEFKTSGTTETGSGRHLVPSLEPYRVSALAHFRERVIPEKGRMRIMVLAPPPGVRPASSLSRMLAWVLDEHGDDGSGWYVSATGLERERLAASLLGIQRDGIPALVLGTTAAFLAFHGYCEDLGVRFALPTGSRIMDTGGRKGSGAPATGSLSEFQASVYERLEKSLGVPRDRCINEYGMTELSSQLYDRDGAESPRVKVSPPWLRTSVLDPVTLKPCPPGEMGLLQHLDLANVGSVMAVLTEDLARQVDGGIVLEGRPLAAEARGCGLTFEELAGLGVRG